MIATVRPVILSPVVKQRPDTVGFCPERMSDGPPQDVPLRSYYHKLPFIPATDNGNYKDRTARWWLVLFQAKEMPKGGTFNVPARAVVGVGGRRDCPT
ncbi:hypothetical protein MPL3365_280010 [Mesorhizobium plurifarium]|uniref:Uncharacterized protein n=1 Tax=Mesorhizobium plurifarium TaxID=69974 RepID=A0A090G682_MESPL|nr:hypothetical protein MPL3365_280010 [Mesorhizobium plurifarium]